MQFPASELEYWSLYFSIDDNPVKNTPSPETVNLSESKKGFKDVWK